MNPDQPNPWDRNRTDKEKERSTIMQPCLLHCGCKITTHFFLLRIWAFRHYNIHIEKEFGPCLHPYFRLIPLDYSFCPNRSDTYHFSVFFFPFIGGPNPLPTPLFGTYPIGFLFSS
jgi:hypothetical protein